MKLRKLSIKLNHNMDTLKLNYKIEIIKFQKIINDYESKIRELTSKNIYTKCPEKKKCKLQKKLT